MEAAGLEGVTATRGLVEGMEKGREAGRAFRFTMGRGGSCPPLGGGALPRRATGCMPTRTATSLGGMVTLLPEWIGGLSGSSLPDPTSQPGSDRPFSLVIIQRSNPTPASKLEAKQSSTMAIRI